MTSNHAHTRAKVIASTLFALICSIQVIGQAFLGYPNFQLVADLVIHGLVGWFALSVVDSKSSLPRSTSFLVPIVALPIYHCIAALVSYGAERLTAPLVVAAVIMWIIIGVIAWAVSLVTFKYVVGLEQS